METLGSVSSLVAGRGEAVLVERFGDDPVLVVAPSEGGGPLGAETPARGVSLDPADTHELVGPGAWQGIAQDRSAVHRVAKREGSLFLGIVSLGRSETNDIQLTSTRVSKHHAILKQDASGAWTVQDNGATNGTFLNEVRLAPREPTGIASGAELRLGDVRTMFVRRPELLALCALVTGQ